MVRQNFVLLLVILFASCSTVINKTQKTQSVQQPPQNKHRNSYTLTSIIGHKFEIEIDYGAKSTPYLNNKCEAQFIITNIGTKDFIANEKFTADKVSTNATFTHLVKYFQPHIVFEFKTSDGKLVEGIENIYDDIPVGKSSQSHRVSINVGDRQCVGEIKPIKFGYKITDK